MTTSPAYSPDYDELAAALQAADIDLSPAEVHGILTGAASVPDGRAPGALFFGRKQVKPTPAVENFLRLVVAFQEDIRARLQGTEFEFQLLLPPSGSDLADEVEALGAWARGYVLGLTTAGVAEPQQLRGEAGEFVADVLSIGEAEMDEDESVEQQEREIAEIVEYLRAGVQLVYDELRA